VPGKFECIGQGGALGVEKLNSAADARGSCS
jgi:hypothetical protein